MLLQLLLSESCRRTPGVANFLKNDNVGNDLPGYRELCSSTPKNSIVGVHPSGRVEGQSGMAIEHPTKAWLLVQLLLRSIAHRLYSHLDRIGLEKSQGQLSHSLTSSQTLLIRQPVFGSQASQAPKSSQLRRLVTLATYEILTE